MAYFETCPNCGCNLDPGEKCDCQEEDEQSKKSEKNTPTAMDV